MRFPARNELRGWLSYARGAGRGSWKLRGESAPAAARLRRSLRRVALPWPAEEWRWTADIESLRAELCASTREIDIRFHTPSAPADVPGAEEEETCLVARDTVGQVCRRGATSRPWGRFLFRLVREFRPERCLELGTSLGISAAYIAAALEVNGRGRLVTVEGAEALVTVAGDNLRRLGLGRAEVRLGRHEQVLPGVVREMNRVDFAYVDGRHEERAVLETLELLWPGTRSGTVLALDDIHWSPEMERAWAAVRPDPRLALAVDLGRIGVCVAR